MPIWDGASTKSVGHGAFSKSVGHVAPSISNVLMISCYSFSRVRVNRSSINLFCLQAKALSKALTIDVRVCLSPRMYSRSNGFKSSFF
jgi:hypothetical protein